MGRDSDMTRKALLQMGLVLPTDEEYAYVTARLNALLAAIDRLMLDFPDENEALGPRGLPRVKYRRDGSLDG